MAQGKEPGEGWYWQGETVLLRTFTVKASREMQWWSRVGGRNRDVFVH